LLLDDSPSLQIGIIKTPIGTIKMSIGTIKIPIGTNNWDVDTYRNKLENVCCIYMTFKGIYNHKIDYAMGMLVFIKAIFVRCP